MSRSIRIVHVTESFAAGVLHCVAMLANQQAEAGSEVLILHSIRPDTPSAQQLDATFDPRIRRLILPMTTQIGLKDCLSSIALMVQLIRKRPDILHLHSTKAAAIGRIAAGLLGLARRTIYSPHGFAFLKRDVSRRKVQIFIWIERLLHAFGGTLIACSRSEGRYARALLSRRRVGVVENAVDLSRFNNIAPTESKATLTVCSSARVSYQKAPWRFTRLATHLSEKSNVRCVWFGDGDEAAVDEWIDKRYVDMTGWISPVELRKQLAECDVFVFASLWEGMPIALIEAQAAGLPAVASRIAGNRDVIRHGVTGFLADNDDELLSYTARLLEDGELRRSMGDAARKYAFNRFDRREFFCRYSKVYDELLARGREAHAAIALPATVLKNDGNEE